MSNIVIEGGLDAPLGPSDFMWHSAATLRRACALNERCLDALAQMAGSNRQRTPPAIIAQHRTLWRGLDGAARKRAADVPFLLLDVYFRDVQWWRGALHRPDRRRVGAADPVFTGKIAGELTRETLMFAWSTVLLDRRIATLLLGMPPAVSAILADFEPQDVERIAQRHSRHLRLRWQDLPAFWRGLLTAARSGDDDALCVSRLRGMQLIGGELLPLLGGSPS